MRESRLRWLWVPALIGIGLIGPVFFDDDFMPGPWTGGEDPRLPPRSEWRLSASANPDRVGLMVDSDPKTRWDTGQVQQGGEWIEVDLGGVYPLRRVILDQANAPHDVPQAYRVEVSAGKGPPPVVVSGAAPFLPVATLCIDLPRGTAGRTVRVIQTGRSANYYWSVYTLQLTAFTSIGNLGKLSGSLLAHFGWLIVPPLALLGGLCLLVGRGRARLGLAVAGASALAAGGLVLRFSSQAGVGRAFVFWGSLLVASWALGTCRACHVPPPARSTGSSMREKDVDPPSL